MDNGWVYMDNGDRGNGITTVLFELDGKCMGRVSTLPCFPENGPPEGWVATCGFKGEVRERIFSTLCDAMRWVEVMAG